MNVRYSNLFYSFIVVIFILLPTCINTKRRIPSLVQASILYPSQYDHQHQHQYQYEQEQQQTQQQPDQLTAKPECRWVPDPGPCHAFFRRFYFNWFTGTCQTFVYGGCDGCVPFRTSQQCEQARCYLLLPSIHAATASYLQQQEQEQNHLSYSWWYHYQQHRQYREQLPELYSHPYSYPSN